jgi:hypothetical protein
MIVLSVAPNDTFRISAHAMVSEFAGRLARLIHS